MSSLKEEILEKKRLLNERISVLDITEKEDRIIKERLKEEKESQEYFRNKSNDIFSGDNKKFLFHVFNEIDKKLIIKNNSDLSNNALVFREGIREAKEIIESFLSTDLILEIVKNKYK